MPDHLAYGLRIRSDVEVPGLLRAEHLPDEVDVTVTFDPQVVGHRFASTAWEIHPSLVDQRPAKELVGPVKIERSLDGEHIAVEYSDSSRFIVSASADAIWVITPEGMTHESVCTYLVNPVLALCIRLRGLTCLHASAVDIEGDVAAFVGPSGAGKSTMVHEFSREGWPVLTDDVAVVTGDPPLVHPAYPRIRLWPWTVRDLLGDPDALPRICDDWEKRGAQVERFNGAAKPLRVVFLLDGYADTLEFERVPTARALMLLMENAYLNYLLDDAGRRRDFEFFGGVTAQVPVYWLRRPHGLAGIQESIAAITGFVTAEAGA